MRHLRHEIVTDIDGVIPVNSRGSSTLTIAESSCSKS